MTSIENITIDDIPHKVIDTIAADAAIAIASRWVEHDGGPLVNVSDEVIDGAIVDATRALWERGQRDLSADVLAHPRFRDQFRDKLRRIYHGHRDPGARRRVLAIARRCILPPPTTANNIEIIAMSVATVLDAMEGSGYPWLGNDPTLPHEIDRVFRAGALVFGVERMKEWVPWLGEWQELGFPRLEISHRLAAALCLTDVPAPETIQAPWDCWSLVVPDGLLSLPVADADGSNKRDMEIARIWCSGATPLVALLRTGAIAAQFDDPKNPAARMVRSLVGGACLAITERERDTKHATWGATKNTTRAPRTCGPPPAGSTYVLAHPVTIDLREHVREVLSGKRRGGGAPKVQFLVRGHWRNQAHGPGRALRRQQWIEPFWKGPEDARVLLRPHHVETEPTS